MLYHFDINDEVVAIAFIAPDGANTISPGMKGIVLERDEIIHRHKVRFENGREVWATSYQIRLANHKQPGKKEE